MTSHCFLVEERANDKENWKKRGIVDVPDIELALSVLKRDYGEWDAFAWILKKKEEDKMEYRISPLPKISDPI